MVDQERETCAHPGCNCPASEDSDYCSSYCEGAGDTPEIDCKCGHPNCT